MIISVYILLISSELSIGKRVRLIRFLGFDGFSFGLTKDCSSWEFDVQCSRPVQCFLIYKKRIVPIIGIMIDLSGGV